MSKAAHFAAALSVMPIVAILRGIRPAEAAGIGEALCRAGIRIIEVPMNSPQPAASIRGLAGQLGESCVIGAGTVLNTDEVDEVVAAGGRLIVSPNTDCGVIAHALTLGAAVVPGVATATEAFQAYAAGARYLKLFPAGSYGASHVRALRAVLPEDARLLGVGGISADNVTKWMSAGVCGVGLGSEIYQPGDTVAAVFEKASAVVAALQQKRKYYEAV